MPDRLALIVANSDFEEPKLTCLVTPGHDAEMLAQVLKDPAIGNFDVTLLLDETERVISREIARLYQRRKRDDLLLFYYSGHGIRDDYGDLYLATRDTETDFISATALNATFVRSHLDKSNSQRKVVVLDCCHSGAFVPGAKAAPGSPADMHEAFMGNGYGRVFLTASNAVEYAWGCNAPSEDAPTSIFTHFLVEGLKTGDADQDRDGQVALQELYDYTYERVLTSGVSKQTPQMWAQKMEGQFIIAKNPHLTHSLDSLPLALQQAVASPFEGLREGAVRELGQLLQDRDSEVVKAAREALQRLAVDADARVSAAAAACLGLPSQESAEGHLSEASQIVPETSRSQVSGNENQEVSVAPDVLKLTTPIKLELVRIPAGAFLMGSDRDKDPLADVDEFPQHRVSLPDFYISRMLITNAHYAVFVRATGHAAPRHWKDGEVPLDRVDHPVTYVLWDDARDFCDWLSRETGQLVRLPTEAEWEKAARGTDGRCYPWGEDAPTEALCNFGGKVDSTTPVGDYAPQGDSPYGCSDMAGNVLEWTQSLYKPYPYDPQDGREDLKSRAHRVLRGGSFINDRDFARCAFRFRSYPNDFNYYYGFRVVCFPSSSAL